ncbi:MAG: hypothetical protein IT423_11710 [Pirellulaceae bacterium]|nr:hypothetical protein [Pirellulaceae bacterium]
MSFYAEEFGAEPGKDCTKQLQAACDAAVRVGGELILKPGTYLANIELKDVRGLVLRGSGRNTTFIQGVAPQKPALSINGFWYSRIQDIGFSVSQALTERAVLEIDGGPKRGVQANTFDNIAVGGQGLGDGKQSRFAVSMCASGGNGAQGSEQCVINCHLSGASQACYYQMGYNALNNQFIGGNFQNYSRHGMQIIFGGIHVFGVGFQSTKGFEQIVNDGWDIVADSGGVGDAIIVAGCRTESLRFYKGAGPQPPQIMSCLQRHAVTGWYKGQAYKIGQAVAVDMPATAQAPAKCWIMRCAMDHTSDKEPNWLSPGPHWAPYTFAVVDIYTGIIDNCNFQVGDIIQREDARDLGVQVSQDYAVPSHIKHVFVDATAGPVKIVLPWASELPQGSEILIVKGDSSANPVAVHSAYYDNTDQHVLALTLKNRVLRVKALGGGGLARRFYRV